MKQKGFKIGQLAAAAGLSRGTISNCINTGATPDTRSLDAEARALMVAPDEIFPIAGYKVDRQPNDVQINRILHYLDNLGLADRLEIEQFAEIKFRKAQKNNSLDQLITQIDSMSKENIDALIIYLKEFLSARGFEVKPK